MEELLTRALALVALLISGILLLAFAWLRSKVKEIPGSSVGEQSLDRALAEAAVVAREAVLYTKQTLTDDLKAKSADGKLTKQEAAEALQRAYGYFVRHMQKESLRILDAALGPIEQWAKEYIEATLGQTKLEEKALSVPKA